MLWVQTILVQESSAAVCAFVENLCAKNFPGQVTIYGDYIDMLAEIIRSSFTGRRDPSELWSWTSLPRFSRITSQNLWPRSLWSYILATYFFIESRQAHFKQELIYKGRCGILFFRLLVYFMSGNMIFFSSQIWMAIPSKLRQGIRRFLFRVNLFTYVPYGL